MASPGNTRAKELVDIHEQRLKEMIQSLQVAEAKLTARVSTALAGAQAEPSKGISALYWKEKLKDVNLMLDTMNQKWMSWVGSTDRGAIVAAVRDGARIAKIPIQALNLKQKMTIPYDSKTIKAFIDDSVAVWSHAVDGAGNKVQRLFRSTQQDLMREKEINFALTTDQLASGGIQKMTSTLTKELTKRSEDGQFLTINGRNYGIADYAELVARTRTREAQTIGAIRTAQEFGVDLMQFSVTESACEICGPYKDQIVSISGTSKDYPPLQESPPFHPKCTCGLTPYQEDIS